MLASLLTTAAEQLVGDGLGYPLNTGLRQLDAVLSGAGGGEVIEVYGLAGQGKTQVCLAAVASLVVREPDVTALYIVTTTGDYEARLRSLVYSTLYTVLVEAAQKRQDAAIGGATAGAGWEEQLLAAFPAAAHSTYARLLAEDADFKQRVEAEGPLQLASVAAPPPWLCTAVCEALVADHTAALDYEAAACLRQVLMARIFEPEGAYRLLREVERATAADTGRGAPAGVGVGGQPSWFTSSRRPVPGSTPAVDARLSLLVLDGVHHLFLSTLGADKTMAAQADVMKLGQLLRYVAKRLHIPVMVANGAKRNREGQAALAAAVAAATAVAAGGKGGAGAAAVAGAAGMEDEDGNPILPPPVLIPADTALTASFSPLLGTTWLTVATARVLLVSPADIVAAEAAAGGPGAVQTISLADPAYAAAEGQQGAGRPIPALPTTFTGPGGYWPPTVPLPVPSHELEALTDDHSGVIRGAVAVHGPGAMVRDCCMVWSIPRAGDSLVPVRYVPAQAAAAGAADAAGGEDREI